MCHVAQSKSRGITPLFPNLSASCGYVVNDMSQALYAWEVQNKVFLHFSLALSVHIRVAKPGLMHLSYIAPNSTEFYISVLQHVKKGSLG